jgi:nucleotide-binding universal stress UspA family protein
MIHLIARDHEAGKGQERLTCDQQEPAISRISSVLALTDFSTQAGVAVARAALLAAQQGARLRLLHIVAQPLLSRLREKAGFSFARVEVDERMRQASRALGNLARRLAASRRIEVDWKVLEGHPFTQVLPAAGDADLVVLGHRGWGFLGPYVPGSMPSRLLARCPSPLLVVKLGPLRPYRRVLMPVDLSCSSPASLAAALWLAPRSEVRLLHAMRSGYEQDMLMTAVPEHVLRDLREMIRARANVKMVELAARFAEQAANVHVSLEFAEILEMIARHEARLQPATSQSRAAAKARPLWTGGCRMTHQRSSWRSWIYLLSDSGCS